MFLKKFFCIFNAKYLNLRLLGVKKADAGRADYSDFATTAKIVKNASVMFVPPQDKHKLANSFILLWCAARWQQRRTATAAQT